MRGDKVQKLTTMQVKMEKWWSFSSFLLCCFCGRQKKRSKKSVLIEGHNRSEREFNGYFLRKVLGLLRPEIHSKRMHDGDGKLGVRNWR